MTIHDAFRMLRPFCGRLGGAGRWLLLGSLLGTLTLIGSLGLLSLSGGFLSAAAVAALTPASIAAFNFFLPGAGVRFFAMLRTLCRWGDRVVTHEATFRLLAALRVWLYGRLARLSPRRILTLHGGDVLNRLLRDVDALDNLYPRFLLPTASAVLACLAMGWFFLCTWPSLWWLPALFLASVLSLLPLAGWALGRRPLPLLMRGRATLRSHLLDCCEALEDFSLHAAAWREQCRRTLAVDACWLSTQLQAARRAAGLRAVVGLLVGLAAWLCLALLAVMAEPGEGPWLVAAVLLILGAGEFLLPLASAAVDLPGTATAADRLTALAEQPAGDDRPAPGLQPTDGSIHIAGLGFAWDADAPILADLNLDIPLGQHVLICGASGCGKTTLVHLLSGFEEAQAGSIEIGGVPLPRLDESTLRRHVACASQLAWAKTATLADNLRLARPDAAAAVMHEVLATVGLEPAKLGWRQGLETWIEAGGASLSGGQRKRLAVAQALLRDAPITILDEPSEGLDSASAQALLNRVGERLRGRTLIWISHRDTAAYPFDQRIELPVLGGNA